MPVVYLDKIGSVTKNVHLEHEVEITDKIICEEGALLAVRVMEDKKIYNQLELPSGRLSVMHRGDIVAVALGNRRALKGFVGKVPKKLAVGDIINVLNLGGVAGICTSSNFEEVGQPLKVKVLGAITHEDKTLNIKDFKLYGGQKSLGKTVPLIIVSGTCMHVGKTTVASEIIKQATRQRIKIYGAKLAGIAALRDTENMRDYGAQKTTSFIDAGYTSTVDNTELVNVTKGAIDYLEEDEPDCIIIEFGDGIFGEYGVMDILKDKEIQKNIKVHIGCANDQPGALKMAETCAKIGVPLDVISGPVTDNEVGKKFIARELSIPSFNAIYESKKLFEHIAKKHLKIKK